MSLHPVALVVAIVALMVALTWAANREQGQGNVCYWSGGIPNAEGSPPPRPSPTVGCDRYQP